MQFAYYIMAIECYAKPMMCLLFLWMSLVQFAYTMRCVFLGSLRGVYSWTPVFYCIIFYFVGVYYYSYQCAESQWQYFWRNVFMCAEAIVFCYYAGQLAALVWQQCGNDLCEYRALLEYESDLSDKYVKVIR